MEEETITNEEVISDNSEIQDEVQEPEVTDNSDAEKTEPEKEPQGEETKEEELIGGKFKNQEELLKAYQEQEKQVGSISNEVGELRKIKSEYDKIVQKQEEFAKSYGFNSAAEMEAYSQQLQVDNDVASFTADEYLKNVNEVEFPDEMRGLLFKYKQTHSPELLEIIEKEFSNSTIKNVARNVAYYQEQLANQRQQVYEAQKLAQAKEYLENVTTKYSDYFKDEVFRNIYTDLFKIYGPTLKTDYVVDMLEKYAQSRISQYKKGEALVKDNADSTDAIEGLKGSPSTGSNKSVLDMTEEELKVALRTTYKN